MIIFKKINRNNIDIILIRITYINMASQEGSSQPNKRLTRYSDAMANEYLLSKNVQNM